MINDSPLSSNDNAQIELKEKMIKDFGVDGYRIIIKLTEKLERKKENDPSRSRRIAHP